MTHSGQRPFAPHVSRAPALSVIVAVHKVQGYLHQCLNSILDQSFRDLELIAVDDCSPDHSGEVLDESPPATRAYG